jgi:plastocyanin
LVAIALAVFGLAACGDDDDGNDEAATEETTVEETTGGGGAGAAIDISSPEDGSLAFDQDTVNAQAGTVTVNFDNPSAVPHDVVIEDESGTEIGKTDLVDGGVTSTSVELQPGTYTFFCDVPGHREGGMEGTLTVN